MCRTCEDSHLHVGIPFVGMWSIPASQRWVLLETLLPLLYNCIHGQVHHTNTLKSLLSGLLSQIKFQWFRLSQPVCVCASHYFSGVSGLGPPLWPVQKTSSWGEQPRPDLTRNLREIPGAMDTPGGIWCKESVICTSNTLLNQSQAANPGVP